MKNQLAKEIIAMNELLKRTHLESNINILRARDFYFDKARNLNYVMKIIIIAPAFATFLGTVILKGNMGKYEYGLLALSLISLMLSKVIKRSIERNLNISNELREEYDCRVLHIERNPFIGRDLGDSLDRYIDEARIYSSRNEEKYEVWYRELFSGNDFCNSLCCMADNIVYSYYIFRDAEKQKKRWLIISCIVLGGGVVYLIKEESIWASYLATLLIAFLGLFTNLLNDGKTARELAISNKRLKTTLIDRAEEYKTSAKKEIILRELEDAILVNRLKDYFISRGIRKRHLKNDSIYYYDMDLIKQIYWGEDISKPEFALEYEVNSAYHKSDGTIAKIYENEWVSLQDIHNELNTMLKDIRAILDKNEIPFMLDGGTLLGSIRKKVDSGFLEWDDDIDIALMEEDVEKAKIVLCNELNDKYTIQDCESEPYYSPRLSTFRIRQKNKNSIIDEKDSELYEKYKSRGLFIDVYSYGSIICNRYVDALIRKIWFHPLNKKIRAVEKKCKYSKDCDSYLESFNKMKRKYIKRVGVYRCIAKCTNYYAYTPYYIDNLKKPGPYIKKSYLLGEDGCIKRTAVFERDTYNVPRYPEMVLQAYYGENWSKEPNKSVKELLNVGLDDEAFVPIAVNPIGDFIYKFFGIYLIQKRLCFVQRISEFQNDYEKRKVKVEKLRTKLNDRVLKYYTFAKRTDIWSYNPRKIKSMAQLTSYYSGYMELDSCNSMGNRKHIYSSINNDLSAYKHIKRVWLAHKI